MVTVTATYFAFVLCTCPGSMVIYLMFPTIIEIQQCQQYDIFSLVVFERGYCICGSFIVIPVRVFFIHMFDFYG